MTSTPENESEEDEQRIHVMFGISGNALLPDTLTTQLGVSPSRVFAKDEEYLGVVDRRREGNEFTLIKDVRKRSTGVWQFSTQDVVEGDDLNEHVRYLLGHLEPSRDTILKYVSSDEFFVSIWIWAESTSNVVSLGISGDLLARLASLCEEVNLSFIASRERSLLGKHGQ
jgi:Domain of unknown function (DUF4279)